MSATRSDNEHIPCVVIKEVSDEEDNSDRPV